jgi:murein DD-endopeptidase MepM/ murein hydrolase activator NlpD
MVGVLVVATALALGVASTAAADEVQLPPAPGAATAPGAAPAPAAPAAAPAATAPVASTVVLRLRIGSVGPAVRDLQRELRRRGIPVKVDGEFGPATKKAVKRMQKRFGMPATGIADTPLLKRLGLQTRAAASAPVTAPATLTTSQYLKVFPVVGKYQYRDDFGEPRHQGPHQGIDIMADRNTPLVAVADAVVSRLSRVEDGLGGIYVWLTRADGVEFYYAHMQSIATGLVEGSKVTAGQVIGAVGNTGDARYGATHCHFEIRPNGTPIDPYPHLVAVDPQRAAAAPAQTPTG